MSLKPSDAALSSVLQENRVFPPPPGFARGAHVPSLEAHQAMSEHARKDPDGFWAEQARELHWNKPWSKVREGQLPDVKWFVGGETNLAFNCLDRHLDGPRRNKAAIV